jgi:hypothetical protein
VPEHLQLFTISQNMKINLALLFIISFVSLSFGQEIIVKSSFENIEYVEDVEWINDDIYCSGYSFKTKINDGNSSDAYLINYDTALKPKWTLKISDEHSNIIYSIKRHKDKIYALVTQGIVQPLTQDLKISLFIISLDGIIENKIAIGRTFFKPSNISIEGENIVFGHTVSDGISYSSNSKSEIIKYNLDTKKIVRFVSSEYQPSPKKVLVNGSDIYLFGQYIHPNQINIMCYRKGKYSEISLKSKKTEYFLDSYIKDNTLIVMCAFPGVYGDMKKYLKYYYVNLNTKVINSVIISYEKMGWSDARFDTYSTGFLSWIIIEDKQTKALKYALIDQNGKISKTLNYDMRNGNGYWENYIIENGKLLNANSSKIIIYKVEK